MRIWWDHEYKAIFMVPGTLISTQCHLIIISSESHIYQTFCTNQWIIILIITQIFLVVSQKCKCWSYMNGKQELWWGEMPDDFQGIALAKSFTVSYQLNTSVI